LTRYRRIDGAHETVVDDEIFVILPGGGDMFHLDAMAAALWRALAEPAGRAELIALFEAAFPDTSPAIIETDIDTALARMIDGGLVDTDA
jgi:hypothetical protein